MQLISKIFHTIKNLMRFKILDNRTMSRITMTACADSFCLQLLLKTFVDILHATLLLKILVHNF